MANSLLKQLEAVVDEAVENELDDYVEFDANNLGEFSLMRLTDKAVLITVMQIDDKSAKGKDHWLPLSQLRSLDGDLYISNWILEKCGIHKQNK